MLRRPVLRTGSSKQPCNLGQYSGQAHALSRKLYHMLYTFTRRAVGFEASGAELEIVYVRTISINDELSICDLTSCKLNFTQRHMAVAETTNGTKGKA